MEADGPLSDARSIGRFARDNPWHGASVHVLRLSRHRAETAVSNDRRDLGGRPIPSLVVAAPLHEPIDRMLNRLPHSGPLPWFDCS